jgi:uncharacterized membrane protein YgdD (TMEM256/DUF423 family)
MKIRPTVWGTLLAGIAVLLGAFGAHFIKDKLPEPEDIKIFETAVQYQMYHSIALILIGMQLKSKPSKFLANAALSFVLGIIFFCGSLYLITIGKLSHGDLTWFGPITPIGGIAFVTGWAMLFYHQITKR